MNLIGTQHDEFWVSILNYKKFSLAIYCTTQMEVSANEEE